MALTQDPRARYSILKHLVQAYFDRSLLFPSDLGSSAEAVHFATLAIVILSSRSRQLGEAFQGLSQYVQSLLSSGADRRELPDVVRVCRAAIRKMRAGSFEEPLCAQSYVVLLCCSLAVDPFLYDAHYFVGTLAFQRYQRRRDPRGLDLRITACRRSLAFAAAPEGPPLRGVEDLSGLGYALRLRLDARAASGISVGSNISFSSGV